MNRMWRKRIYFCCVVFYSYKITRMIFHFFENIFLLTKQKQKNSSKLIESKNTRTNKQTNTWIHVRSWIESLLFLCTKVARWLCSAVPYRAVQCFAVPFTCAISMFFTSFSLLSVCSLSPFEWVYWIMLMFENWQAIRWGKWIQPYCCSLSHTHTYHHITTVYSNKITNKESCFRRI